MPFKQKIWSLSTVVTPSLAEAIADSLGETALAVSTLAPPRKPTALVEALYDAPPNLPALTAQLSVVAMIQGAKMPKLTLKEMPKLDWLKKVAEDFPPLPIARWTIHGAQHRHKVPNRHHALQIDATNAFGTGEHPTTRGCLLMLDWMLARKIPMRNMLDVGCGSGILAMAFAKARHRKAVGVELDLDSVITARNNVAVNGLQKLVHIGQGRGYRSALVKRHAPYDLIMANIFAGPLSEMAKDLQKHLSPGGVAILSGLLNHQANRVIAAHHMQKLYVIKRLQIGEWSVLALKRRQRA